VSAIAGHGGGTVSAGRAAAGKPGRRPAELWRSFVVAAKLGWALEANWTDPLLFFIYSIAKPLASAFILVFMLEVIGGPAGRALRPFVIVGSALWTFVASGISGLAWAILEDRERYRVLKYVYVSPSHFLTVLMGRGVARIAVGIAGVVITLIVGVLVLGLSFDLAVVNWPLLIVTSLLGLVSIIALGILMAGVCIQTRQESWSYPEAFASAMFLVTGAVFPLTVLPLVIQPIGLLMPLTWWIAGVRAALFPGIVDSIGGEGSAFAAIAGHLHPSTVEIVVALLVTGVLSTLAALAVFRWSDRRAKQAGLYDQTSGS
jgi:ABC-2 type transport system permease protein